MGGLMEYINIYTYIIHKKKLSDFMEYIYPKKLQFGLWTAYGQFILIVNHLIKMNKTP